MNGFFEAITPQSVVVTLAGQEVNVARARLGLHLRLGRLSDSFDNAPGSPEMGAAIRAYFDLLEVDISGASAVEILRAFSQLRELNAWQWALAFMKGTGKPKEAPEPYDYPGRNWAWVVHKMASRYSWTREEIFNLWPEEAAAYLQEILIAEHFEAEERYRLSELAYQYDSTSKTSRYIPYRKPSWMYSEKMPEPVRILKSMLPMGVLDLNNNPVTYH
jgi:hypothetical protein